METASRRSFLQEDFRLFRLRDNREEAIDYHYHEFDKLVLFLSGDASYIIEGRSYHLEPWDLLYVPHHEIHRPVIRTDVPYERVVIWVDPAFLARMSTEKSDLSAAFRQVARQQKNLVSLWPEMRVRFSRMIEEVEGARDAEDFGADILYSASFARLMVASARLLLNGERTRKDSFDYDPKISQIMRFINDNLTADLSIEAIAGHFYMSRYHFMRKFKEVTGYTVHNYVRQKRLALASRMIGDGASPSEAAELSGFADYSSFLRAFKQQFSITPKEFAQNAYRREEIVD